MSVSWEEAFSRVGEALSTTPGNHIKAVVGQLVEAESMIALKDLFNRLGSSNLYFEGESGTPSHGADFRFVDPLIIRVFLFFSCEINFFIPYSYGSSNYLFNSGIAKVEDADCVLLIGTNPRVEAPLINARLRKGYIHRGLTVGMIGSPAKLTCEYTHLGQHLYSFISMFFFV